MEQIDMYLFGASGHGKVIKDIFEAKDERSKVKELNNIIIINRHCADNKHVVGMSEMRLPLDLRYAAQANIVA